jgi:hypothetical protein
MNKEGQKDSFGEYLVYGFYISYFAVEDVSSRMKALWAEKVRINSEIADLLLKALKSSL